MKTIERLKQLLAKATGGTWHGEVDNPRTLGDVTSDTGGVVANVIVCFDECEDEAVATTELIAESHNALPALLAVVEAQAAEIAAWREVDIAASAVMKIMRIHGDGALVEEMKEVAMQKKDIVRGTRIATDAALRALEGGE